MDTRKGLPYDMAYDFTAAPKFFSLVGAATCRLFCLSNHLQTTGSRLLPLRD